MALIKYLSTFSLCCLFGGLFSFAAAESRQTYTLTEIPPLPREDARPYAWVNDLNDAGQVVGGSFIYVAGWGTAQRPFIWDAAHGTEPVGNIGGVEDEALAINNSGQILLNHNADCLYDPVSGMVTFGSLGTGGTQAYDLNDAGEVVGVSCKTSFIWNAEDGIQSLGVASEYRAKKLNNSGRFLVYLYPGDGVYFDSWQWYMWDAVNGLQQIIDPDGNDIFPMALNDENEVVGHCVLSDDSTFAFAFIWDPENGMRQLSSPTESAYVTALDVNNVGQIVGDWADVTPEAGSDMPRAILWNSETEEPTDLNTLVDLDPRWTLVRALKINDNGDIVAEAWDPSEETPEDGIDYDLFFLKAQTEWTLITATSGEGAVSPTVGEHWYAEGSAVPLTATPADGWCFSCWVGADDIYANPTSVVVDGSKEVTAVFLRTRTLTTSVDGLGTTDPPADQHEYSEGTQVTISATPRTGWAFANWVGVADVYTNPLTVVMNEDMNITAIFVNMVSEDLNDDGDTNAIDVQLVINSALGLGGAGSGGDVNKDGHVDALDVQSVINAALGI